MSNMSFRQSHVRLGQDFQNTEKGEGERKKKEREGEEGETSPHKKIQLITCYSVISSSSLVNLNQRDR